jgi:hypothetical protein
VASVVMGRVASHTCPFTFAANTFRANHSLIDFAISKLVDPSWYSRTFPSGKVILIILSLPFFVAGNTNYCFVPLYRRKNGKFNEQFADHHLRYVS